MPETDLMWEKYPYIRIVCQALPSSKTSWKTIKDGKFINLIEYLSTTWDKDCIHVIILKHFIQIEEKDKYVLMIS